MTKYATGNPVGSSDPRDLYDNAENLDNLVNGDQAAYNDRLGKSRRSWQSVEDQVNQQADQYADDKEYRDSTFASDQTYRANAFQAAQDDREGIFNAYLVSAGYTGTAGNGDVEDYAAGIEITQYNQVVRDTSGEFWRVSGSTNLPYTTTGAGLPEGGNFVAVGDAVLRQELALPVSGGNGALHVSGAVIYVDTISDLQALPTSDLVDGQKVQVKEYHAGTGVGGGEFYWDAASSETDNGGTILEVSGAATGRWRRASAERYSVEQFGVRSSYDADVAYNTARMQAAWNHSGAANITLTFESDGLADPYYVSGLDLVSELSLEAEAPVAIELPSTLWGGSGFFIRRPDDGVRYRRIRMKNILFGTATSGVTAAQDQNENLAGMAYVGCEAGYFENVTFTGFGQGGMILARAEGGAEGLGFINTSQDGNYNTFVGCNGNACGRYRTNVRERAAYVLLYKANSNNFYALYCRGNTNSSTLAIEYGSNNNVFGGTGESVEYAVRLGALAANNNIYGVRGEGVTAVVKGYEYTGVLDTNGPLAWNTVMGVHLSSGTSEVERDTGSNIFNGSTGRDPLRFRKELSDSAVDRADGLIDVLGARHRGSSEYPFLIMSTGEDGRTSNAPEYIPALRLWSNHAAPSSGQITGSVQFTNGRVDQFGVATAKIDAVHAGSGYTNISFKTGRAPAAEEALRVGSIDSANSIYLPVDPGTDNLQSLGSSGKRWSEIYAGNGTVNTSDEREKEQQRSLSDAERNVAIALKSSIKAFKWKDAVERKGDGARWHIGVMAQEVAEIFAAEGLDAHEYGMFCLDEWYDGPEVTDENGNTIEQEPNRSRYGVRYDQLLAFILSTL